jgi:hypothetical protein
MTTDLERLYNIFYPRLNYDICQHILSHATDLYWCNIGFDFQSPWSQHQFADEPEAWIDTNNLETYTSWTPVRTTRKTRIYKKRTNATSPPILVPSCLPLGTCTNRYII